MEKYIQLTASRGPAECCWVVAQVLKVFLSEAKSNRVEATVIQREEGDENRTLLSATVQLNGDNLDAFLKTWLGTIQWIGKSTFRKFHKRKNWFIGMFELQFDNSAFVCNDSDITFQAIRSSGPGGQHTNKVSSAVRATHIPTNVSVLASDSRSQHQNRKIAKERLLRILQIKQMEEKASIAQASWQNHDSLERGNAVRVFHGHDFKSKTVDKRYKSKRQKLKNELHRGKYDL